MVFYVASDTSPLYQILKQSDNYLWRYCILKIGGYKCRLAVNTVVLVLREYQISIAMYRRGYLPTYKRDPSTIFRVIELTSSGSTGGSGGDAKTNISPNTSYKYMASTFMIGPMQPINDNL